MNASRTDFAPEPVSDADALKLGIPGFSYADLYKPARLRDLFNGFMDDLDRREPTVGLRYREIVERGTATRDEESWIACSVGPHVSRFVGALFGVEGARKALVGSTRALDVLLRTRKEFVKRRVLKRPAAETIDASEGEALRADADRLAAAFDEGADGEHKEFAFARAIVALLDVEADRSRRATARRASRRRPRRSIARRVSARGPSGTTRTASGASGSSSERRRRFISIVSSRPNGRAPICRSSPTAPKTAFVGAWVFRSPTRAWSRAKSRAKSRRASSVTNATRTRARRAFARPTAKRSGTRSASRSKGARSTNTSARRTFLEAKATRSPRSRR
jgi:hypothetical protein